MSAPFVGLEIVTVPVAAKSTEPIKPKVYMICRTKTPFNDYIILLSHQLNTHYDNTSTNLNPIK